MRSFFMVNAPPVWTDPGKARERFCRNNRKQGETMTPNLLSSYVLLAFGLAVGGGALGTSVGTSHKRLCALISLGAGTLLGVTVFAILPECWEALTWWGLVLAMASGYLLFAVISKYVYHVCPACAASHFDQATTHRFSEIASAMVIALAIHSTMDGVALVAGHEAGGHPQGQAMAAR